jgi:putative flippase GtrA
MVGHRLPSPLISTFQRLFAGRIARFAAVGVTVTLFFMGLNALFGWEFGLRPQVSFLIAYPPALALHFLLNKLWTFGDRGSTTHHQLGEYLFSVVVTFLIQWPTFLLFQRAFGLPGWVAAGGANLVQMSMSYALLRWRVFHGSPKTSDRPLSNPWHRIVLLLVVLGGTALIYWTSMCGWETPHFERSSNDYYNLLVSGFRKGSLAMDVQVPEALRNAENPWDPGKRPPGIVLHDASYFNGHYYLYFGVVPAVLLFWPFRAVSGFALPFGLATIVFLIGAFLISAWLWLTIVRDRFPRAGLLTRLAGPVILGLCGGQLVLARRSSIWEMPIAGGHFFMMCLLAAGYLALRARKPWVALAAAGLSLGLAIGCRPTLAAAGPALAFLVIRTGWAGTSLAGRLVGFLKSLLYAGIPFAAVIAGLFAYNWRRFGNALEFGLNYQLTGNYEAKAHHFLLRFAPFNLGAYFLRAPQWGRYFPFVHPQTWVSQPAGYYGMEYVYGALAVCPVIFGTILSAGLAWRKKGRVEESFAVFVAMVAIGTTFLLVCFNTAAARYVPDFLPWWLWLALLGWAWLEGRLDEMGHRARFSGQLVEVIYGLCVAATLTLAFVQSAALHGILVNRNPSVYRQISRVFDFPAAAWERANHENTGPLTMDVVFPEFHGAVLEPLLVTGVEYETDYFFVYYKAPGVVLLGFTNSGESPVYTEDIEIKPGQKYHLRFEGGALYPPDGHPVYLGWTEGQVHAAKVWLRIALDGRLVLNQPRQFQEGAPEFLQVGSDIRSGAFGRRFMGTVSDVRREPLVREPELGSMSGDVVLTVMLPREIVPGSQPLLVAGKAGTAELVGYRPVDEKHFVLTYEKWGGGYWESDPITTPANREATFRIRLGSILPEYGPYPQGLYRDLLIVWMDGQPVWWRRAFGGIGRDPPLDIMVNMIGSSAMRPLFQGTLLATSREPVPDWKSGPFKTLEIDLAGRGSGIQPLVVTGVPGSADLLAIEWLPNNTARLLLDHWSHAIYSSPTFSWESQRMHHLRITLPSFEALDGPADSPGIGMLSIEADGRPLWDENVLFYRAPSSTFAFGKNTVGSSIALPALDCRLGDIRQGFGGK